MTQAPRAMTLREKQALFARLLGLLLTEVYNQGWEVTLGESWVDARRASFFHMRGSLHRQRLAQDLVLWVDNEMMTSWCPEWDALGQFWLSLDSRCRWGGDWNRDGKRDKKDYDFGHFSVAHGGKA